MVAALFVPLWQIDLDAPQYPEGLRLLIYPHKIDGDIDIINGLNHYIGMKTIHYNEFWEFTFLPYAIGGFGVLFLLSALIAKRWGLLGSFAIFALFGVLAMYDFWRWEYDYGHNLDPNAAIKVPGMAYQPPLIGFKQLLNFGAYSMPSTGGWLFVVVGGLLLFGLIYEYKFKSTTAMLNLLFISIFNLLALSSCQPEGPVPIKIGKEDCGHCKMTISDAKFAAELITDKGKVYKFDEFLCLKGFIHSGKLGSNTVKSAYVSNYNAPHQLLDVKNAFFLKSPDIHGPMNGNVAVFASEAERTKAQASLKGTAQSWDELLQK